MARHRTEDFIALWAPRPRRNRAGPLWPQVICRWDQENDNPLVVKSVPLLIFIDGFGLFRNTYRSLVGYYVTPASFSAQDRRRRMNTFPLFLSPHGFVWEEVVDTLWSLIPLDKGIEVDIGGQKTLLCVFMLCYIGDMPQQNANSGTLRPRASKYCPRCIVGKKINVDGLDNPLAILQFDKDSQSRYHHQAAAMRKQAGTLNATRKRAYCSQWGMTLDEPALARLTPASDLVAVPTS
ncbi:hypothetical protein B0H63DRAFT_405406 [Podospora didyma]|uniref:Uncharacterized protein n=1 Tax=Podospora didyma TaxID=330526 RepID=A0AAE0JYT0_9PEZI|nr:hypothetical protein B0H63DRAFT_405406 [Podospora didyma]